MTLTLQNYYNPLPPLVTEPPRFRGRLPVRPLEEISEYVVTKLPQDLTYLRSLNKSVRDQAIERLKDQTEKVATLLMKEERKDQQSSEAKVALHDCTMLESALATHGATPGPNLQALTNMLAERAERIPELTYEGLIHSNPLDRDPRTFSTNDTAQSEIFFYHVHRQIEETAAGTISTLSTLTASTDKPDPLLLQKVATGIDHMSDQVDALLDFLPQDHFTLIRPYFNNTARKSNTGPSGLHSAGIFVIDALVHGENAAMQKFLSGKMRDVKYYPKTEATKDRCTGQKDMEQAMAAARNHQTLFAFSRQHPEDPVLHRVLGEIIESIITFRTKHLELISKFIPDAVKGTGGKGDEKDEKKGPTGLMAFLHIPIDIYEDALKELHTSFPPSP